MGVRVCLALRLACLLGVADAAKSGQGLGDLPGEEDYIAKTLPNDLSYAAMIGDAVSARRVISFGVDVNAPDREGLTPLLRAVVAGHADVAALLLEHGADATTAGSRPDAVTPIHAAAWACRHDIYQMLRAAGADPMAPAADGFSTLHRVAWSSADTDNHTALWELMLTERHVPPATANAKDGRTALHVAAATGLSRFVSALLNATRQGPGGDAAVRQLANTQDREGRTALHQAANRTRWFEPPATISEGVSFEQITAYQFEANQGMAIMQALVRAGADGKAQA